MIEPNNPEINVDDLMEQIRQEVAKRNLTVPRRNNINQNIIGSINLSPDTTMSVLSSRLQALLNDASLNSQSIDKLPNKLNRFPLKIRIIQKVILKLYNFVFKKQGIVNQNFISAFKELQELTEVKINQKNQELINTLNKRFEFEREISENHYQALEQKHQALEQKHTHQIKALQLELTYNKKTFANLLQSLENRTGFSNQQITNIPTQPASKSSYSEQEEAHLLDAFYVAFEEKFRGSYEEIAKRLKVYLPFIEQAKEQASDTILDLGCGRGEWLEFLREKGYQVQGIDLNRMMLEECRSKNLEVYEVDAIAHIQTLADNSLGAVTGFHIIEHLPFPALLQLLQETIRVLKPGGVAIFETPNPQNILVSTRTFYLDPTHRNPLPSDLIQFLLDNTGFEPVEVLPLHPYEEALQIKGTEELTQRFNQYFYGPQDYAIIGYKPCNPSPL
ncbi:methyltransferase domain-containing protein [Spirulina subsalsa FACHB-351]|uniref:Methyltransferase domain-containing protein n=1 Tax=Spirulina subsalsa FACHB-351 TaxID=234711 RepID=A0ABT3L8L3_9CYAN|nr:methyltransferase domain-containing protein [Spirulina subsalsa]MCW6037300.1 methyltransferase domain-containing protein [Spirulina subsalsa FACHB-351]